MVSKDILKKIAYIYQHDPDKGRHFMNMLFKADIDEEDMAGMSVVDNPDDELDDEAAQWLAEAEKKLESGETKDKSKPSSHRDWRAPENLTDEQRAKIEQHMEDGYSEREAHRLVGTHKEVSDFQQAMRSGIKPSMMSDRMIDHIKGLAKEWLSHADKHEKLHADVEKNPMKHAAGKIMAAHDEHMGDYKKALNEFMTSDEVKNLKGRERHKAISEWKKNYREQNPGHHEKLSSVSAVQSAVPESRQVARQTLQDKLTSIMHGGGAAPGESYSAQEGAQHAGISLGGEGEKATGSITKDPAATFAAGHQKLMGMLSDEQKARYGKINSARAMQGKQPQTVIRRKKNV